MKPSGHFWELVRHEFKLKGNWRKRNRSPVAKWWWVIYFSLLVIGGIAASAYFAVSGELRLESLWYVTMGFPYMLFFIGFGILKQEWENETYGWWLTLPFPRFWLVSAKWTAAMKRMLVILLGVIVVGLLYASVIAAALADYTFSDVGTFLQAGLNWMVIIIGFSPLILALGMFTMATPYTVLRPLTPMLWILSMSAGSLFYNGFGARFKSISIFDQLSGKQPVTAFPFSWELLATMAVSWVLGYLVLRLCAYLLEKKLSL